MVARCEVASRHRRTRCCGSGGEISDDQVLYFVASLATERRPGTTRDLPTEASVNQLTVKANVTLVPGYPVHVDTSPFVSELLPGGPRAARRFVWFHSVLSG